MKICVISDLHCKYQLDVSDSTDTFLISNMPRIPSTHHPVASMISCIEKNNYLESEILLCLGDLGDKADEQGIMSAWTFTQEIGQHIKANLCIGIPGNHDINSRRKNSKDAFSYIKNFHEAFPTNSAENNQKFWEYGYCFESYNSCLLLIINSVHDHEDEEHAKHTTLRIGLIERLRSELDQIDNTKFPIKICILHHHPVKHSNINNAKDSDSCENGDDLLNELVKHNFNLVIHGHKHQPRIIEYMGLPVLAAGSFSSNANLLGTGFNTMFHVIDLDEHSKQGTIDSWEYDKRNGWTQKLNSFFPPNIGFGANIESSIAADMIYSIFTANNNQPTLYSQIENAIPEIKNVIPDKLVQIGKILKEKYSLIPDPDYPLKPIIITKLFNK